MTSLHEKQSTYIWFNEQIHNIQKMKGNVNHKYFINK